MAQGLELNTWLADSNLAHNSSPRVTAFERSKRRLRVGSSLSRTVGILTPIPKTALNAGSRRPPQGRHRKKWNDPAEFVPHPRRHGGVGVEVELAGVNAIPAAKFAGRLAHVVAAAHFPSLL